VRGPVQLSPHRGTDRQAVRLISPSKLGRKFLQNQIHPVVKCTVLIHHLYLILLVEDAHLHPKCQKIMQWMGNRAPNPPRRGSRSFHQVCSRGEERPKQGWFFGQCWQVRSGVLTEDGCRESVEVALAPAWETTNLFCSNPKDGFPSRSGKKDDVKVVVDDDDEDVDDSNLDEKMKTTTTDDFVCDTERALSRFPRAPTGGKRDGEGLAAPQPYLPTRLRDDDK